MGTGNHLTAYWGGGGEIIAVVGTQPALGANWVQLVPVGRRWRLISFHIELDNSGVAGTRFPGFSIRSPAGVQVGIQIIQLTGQTANQTRQYNFMALGSDLNVFATTLLSNSVVVIPPRIILAENFIIQGETANLNGGDQYEAPVFFVEEWEA